MFDLADEQKLIQKTARDFAAREILPHVSRWDAEKGFPRGLVGKLGETGLMGIAVPDAHGGAGMDPLAAALALEEIAAADASVSVMVSVHNSLVCDALLRFGDESQKKRHLPRLASGEALGCFAISEPDSGSDAAAMRATAKREGDAYVLNGSKAWITSGDRADLAVVFASTDPTAGKKGISAFVAETAQPGWRAGPPEKKMGLHASRTVAVYLENFRVPAENLLGKEGEGFKIALCLLDGGRIGIAAQAVGIARAALDASLKYAQVRKQFGKPIASFQAVQWMLADTATAIDAARLLVWRAAALKGAGAPFVREAAMAKLFATEAAGEACRKAVQVFGGYGYTRDYPVEKYFRDVRATEIYEGTSEIQRLVIAREILKETAV